MYMNSWDKLSLESYKAKCEKIEKVLSDLEASSSSSDDKIVEVSYYTSESKSESEYKTSDYYDNSTTHGLFVDNNDDQEIFHDSSEIFSKNLIESEIDHNESDVTHNDYEDVAKLINQMIKESNKNIAKYQKRENNELIEKNDDLLAQRKSLQEQLKVKHIVIDNHVECQGKYAKLEAERYEYMIRYSAYFDNDKQHRKKIVDQEILFDKMSRQLVELDENVRMLKNTILEKDLKISELGEDIWNAIKARFGGNAESKKMQKSLLKQRFEEFNIFEEERLDKGYDKMQKILSQMNTLKIKPEPEDINIKF
nr:ribonuclease H-like domain-containing protein [Tanacetum cinerariifolium]